MQLNSKTHRPPLKYYGDRCVFLLIGSANGLQASFVLAHDYAP